MFGCDAGFSTGGLTVRVWTDLIVTDLVCLARSAYDVPGVGVAWLALLRLSCFLLALLMTGVKPSSSTAEEAKSTDITDALSSPTSPSLSECWRLLRLERNWI